MKTRLFLAASLLTLAAIAQAQDSSADSSVTTSAEPRSYWKSRSGDFERLLSPKDDSPRVRLGKSGLAAKGPVVEGIVSKRATGERSLGKRLAELPVVRMVVPQPMAPTPGGGKYFRWGESDRPWIAVAQEATTASTSGNLINHEARTSLISIVR